MLLLEAHDGRLLSLDLFLFCVLGRDAHPDAFSSDQGTSGVSTRDPGSCCTMRRSVPFSASPISTTNATSRRPARSAAALCHANPGAPAVLVLPGVCSGVCHQGSVVSVPHGCPCAHVEVAAGSVILGPACCSRCRRSRLVRFAFPLFPLAAAFLRRFATLAVIGIIYALVAMVQPV